MRLSLVSAVAEELPVDREILGIRVGDHLTLQWTQRHYPFRELVDARGISIPLIEFGFSSGHGLWRLDTGVNRLLVSTQQFLHDA
jgi:hypothetical protein